MFWLRIKQFLSRPLSVLLWLLLLILGLGVGGTIWWLVGPGRRPWLELLKDKEGVIMGVRVDPQRIPRAVLDQLPSPGDDTPVRDKAEIQALAERHGLYQSWKINPHLTFEDWVIDYWSKQGRPAWDLELQFLSRRLVLEAAERGGVRIPYPGDLSRWAERVYPVLLKRAQEK